MNAPRVEKPPASRRFNLGDGLILIAALALVIESHQRRMLATAKLAVS